MAQQLTKPCEIPCPKCGSADVSRYFRAKGEIVRGWVYGKQPNEYMAGPGTYSWTAQRDHIHNDCRSCHYEWATLPLKQRKAR